jgi:hypothetical protein
LWFCGSFVGGMPLAGFGLRPVFTPPQFFQSLVFDKFPIFPFKRRQKEFKANLPRIKVHICTNDFFNSFKKPGLIPPYLSTCL